MVGDLETEVSPACAEDLDTWGRWLSPAIRVPLSAVTTEELALLPAALVPDACQQVAADCEDIQKPYERAHTVVMKIKTACKFCPA